MSYLNNPEVICNVRVLKNEDETCERTVVALSCSNDSDQHPGGLLSLDVQGAMGKDNVVIDVDAEQFMQAVTRAMLNRDA